ncbi:MULTISPECIES: TetR/AcrR family transcriptional regulator [unclassified Lentimonas]|uniref:TetR/AcrR family transcriptional regulator n=1 Tax=unclassified Lentimonas TaxID=2630993 RepID=UPI00132421DD|nr:MULTISPECIES: TetR/AcrR family transcriptional regulator [unclassified Lentimonas]CAA6679730.1 Unannotated [Lentimonas sp. CC4]CAA6683504.1 Unannotated [Lentimonas sp. CC6]CAA6693223.1 Unannotated [Lentimonas sp. CC10]CAA6695487.1 Unannotated [Lentimonas sp. CC19]CAA7071746.1 Unannotated [Lentimonas sp. CC11]
MGHDDKREALLVCAYRLFERQGFNGTGVDQIAAESGVTKRTLYKHFGSKEGLIEAVLEQHQAELIERMRTAIFTEEQDCMARFMRCFDLYREWFGCSTFAGCIFMKTINEFAGCSSNLSGIAQQSKIAIREILVEVAAEGKLRDPALLADQLQLVLEGAIVVAQYGACDQAIETARSLARSLIEKMR